MNTFWACFRYEYGLAVHPFTPVHPYSYKLFHSVETPNTIQIIAKINVTRYSNSRTLELGNRGEQGERVNT